MIFIKALQKMLKQGLKLNRPLPPKGKNKKVISVTKDELGGRIMKQFVELIAKI